jgi:hypothetical protein
MSGFEVISAVAFGIQLSQLVIDAFRTVQNAPRQVRRLNGLLKQLNDPRLRLTDHKDDLACLKELLDQTNELLQQHAPSAASSGAFVPFRWPATAEKELRESIGEIRDELTSLQIRVGLWG